jgi:LacI family transcriptional regulator
MPTQKHSVTLRDVAKACGLSVFPVSRALNNKSGVNPKTLAKVRKAADELGYDYAQHHAARSLALSKSGKTEINKLIAVVMPSHFEQSNYFFQLFKGVSEVTTQRGYGLLLFSNYDETKGAFPPQFPPLVMRGELDGIIYSGNFDEMDVTHLRSKTGFGERPIVTMGNKNQYGPAVMGNFQQGGELALKHLLEQGHRRIFYYTKGKKSYEFSESLTGYKKACRSVGLKASDCLIPIKITHDHLIEKPLLRAIGKHPDATALLAHNDPVALTSIYALREKGFSIPEQFSIIGQDDTDSLFDVKGNNSLTSIAYHTSEIGRQAANILTDLIEEKRDAKEITLMPASLVVRKTTNQALSSTKQ